MLIVIGLFVICVVTSVCISIPATMRVIAWKKRKDLLEYYDEFPSE